jgi:hypothetical protein
VFIVRLCQDVRLLFITTALSLAVTSRSEPWAMFPTWEPGNATEIALPLSDCSRHWMTSGGSSNSWAETIMLLSLSPAVISRCRSWVMLLLVYVGPRATHFTRHCCWLTKVCGASGNTLYWVLLLVYVGSRATHFTGYGCWFMWGLGQHTLLGIVVGHMWFTLASGIVVGLCGASGNTLYWVLLLVYVGPWATHITGSGLK